jgi:osmotically inducible lipoprotein OsmB
MRTYAIIFIAATGLALGACTTTQERIGGAAVGAAVAGPVGAAAGVVAGPPVADATRRAVQ